MLLWLRSPGGRSSCLLLASYARQAWPAPCRLRGTCAPWREHRLLLRCDNRCAAPPAWPARGLATAQPCRCVRRAAVEGCDGRRLSPGTYAGHGAGARAAHRVPGDSHRFSSKVCPLYMSVSSLSKPCSALFRSYSTGRLATKVSVLLMACIMHTIAYTPPHRPTGLAEHLPKRALPVSSH